jgi:hypothetical protein
MPRTIACELSRRQRGPITANRSVVANGPPKTCSRRTELALLLADAVVFTITPRGRFVVINRSRADFFSLLFPLNYFQTMLLVSSPAALYHRIGAVLRRGTRRQCAREAF